MGIECVYGATHQGYTSYAAIAIAIRFLQEEESTRLPIQLQQLQSI